MAQLTPIQKAVYANQTLALEREGVVRAARVVAKARNTLLSAVKRRGATTTVQEATLRNLDAVLKTLPKDVMKELRLESLVEKGYRQGRSLLEEVAKDTEHSTKISGYAGILDLQTYAQDTNEAVANIQKISEVAKAKIQEAASISLALGEGEVDTMRRIFGDAKKPGENNAFRRVKISAERISRTVTNSLVNTGKLAAYTSYAEEFPELEITNEWVNVTDFRTSDTCLALVGQRRLPGQPFQGGGFSGTHPPAHVNCRSTLIPVIGEPLEPDKQEQPSYSPPVSSEPLGEKVFKARKEQGVTALKTILGEEKYKEVTTLSKEFRSLASAMRSTDDPDTVKALRSQLTEMRSKVDAVGEQIIAALIEAQSENLNNLKFNYNDPNEPLEWTDSEDKKHSVALDKSTKDHPQSHLVRSHLKRAVSILGGEAVEGVRFVYLDKGLKKSEGRNRGWANFNNKTVNIGGRRGKASLSTILHEVAHFIELETPGAREASMHFIKSRATGEPQRLRDLTGITAYGDSEVAYPDEFIDVYVGRLYGGVNPGTEVLSMGLQVLNDPSLVAGLLLYDPEHLIYALSYVTEGLVLPKPKSKSKSKSKPKPQTYKEYSKSLPKEYRAKLRNMDREIVKAAKREVSRQEMRRTESWVNNLSDKEVAQRANKLSEKWRGMVAKSAFTLANTEKVTVQYDPDKVKDTFRMYDVRGKDVVLSLAMPTFGPGSTDSEGGTPYLSVSFSVNGEFDSQSENVREGVKVASEIRKLLADEIAKLPDGTVLHNEPTGGALGKRAFIYSMQGFGPTSPSGNQYAIVKGGKAVPITEIDYENLKEGDSI